MKKLKELYNESIDEQVDVDEQVTFRKEKYASYKKVYVQKCRAERKSRYSFFQRNSIAVIIVVLAFLGICGVNFVKSCENLENNSQIGVKENIADNQKMEVKEDDFDDSNGSGSEINKESTDNMSETNKEEISYVKGNNSKEKQSTKENKSQKDDNVASKEIKIGSVVTFAGNVQYNTSYSNATVSYCTAGKAKVTKINPGGVHPYHLTSTEKGCTVYGWVDEKDIVVK